MKSEIILKVGNYKISVDFLFIVLTLIMLVFGYFSTFIITLASIFLHELGHILTAAYLGCKISSLRILPIGLNAVIDDNMCSIREKLIINFSGPCVNIVLVFFSFLINFFIFPKHEKLVFIMLVNIYLFVFNLLPVLPLDGGRILRDILADRFGIFLAGRYMKRFSLFFSVFVILIGVQQMINSKNNYSLVVVGIYLVLTSTFKKTEAAIMNIKSVIYRRSRLMKKGIYPARDLVVVKSIPISELLKNMDFDRFHIIHVLDEELRLLKTYTEQEIIDGILSYDTDMTFDEFIKRSS